MEAHVDPKDDRENHYVPLATFHPEPTRSNIPDYSRDLTPTRNRNASQVAFFNLAVRLIHRGVELFNNNTGLLLIALSQEFVSLMGVFVKKLNELDASVHPLELIWIRMAMTWVVCVSYMSSTKVPSPFLGPEGVRVLLAVRGLSGFVGLFGTYYALQYLSLSDATVLSFLTPMTTAIAGALLLKEVLTLKQVLASVFSFVGVILIARPVFLFGKRLQDPQGSAKVVTSSERLGAIGVALLGVIGITGAYTSVRAIGKRAHPMHNIAAFSFVCIITAPIAAAVTHTPVVIPDNWLCLAMILAVSVCGFAAQMTLTTGLQRETAGRGSMAIYIQVIFALIFERAFFHSTPPPLSIVGTVIILSSAIYIALSKKSSGSKPASQVSLHPDESALEEGLLADAVEAEEELGDDELTKLAVKGPAYELKGPSREKFAIGSEESLSQEPDIGPSSSKSISSIDGI